jgi:hypothetical protein
MGAELGPVDGMPVQPSPMSKPLLAEPPFDANRSDVGADPSALVEDIRGKFGGHSATLARS